MKIDSVSLVNDVFQTLGNRTVSADQARLQWLIHGLATAPNGQIASSCRGLLAGTQPLEPVRRPAPYYLLAFLRKLILRPLSDGDLNALAHGIEAFRRAPADLEVGAQLYPEQERAALALMQNAVIQLDTGEGKTYAILPAAFALATRYAHVYIVCANDYLSRRDALRTRRYWDFLGIIPGIADEFCDEREWSRRIIYTTMSRLLFKYMADQTSRKPPEYPISFGAVLLDDADVILLDDATTHTHVWEIAGKAFNWDFAFSFCERLSEGDTIEVFDLAEMPTATLTVTGEELLRAELGAGASRAGLYLLARQAAELAYLAKKVLREGDHYVVETDGVFPINRADGRVMRVWVPDWLPALQASRGMPVEGKRVVCNQMKPSVMIKKFAVHSGMSGTVSSDALEYLLGYRLRPVRIPPRCPRYNGLRPESVYRTAASALEDATDTAAAAVAGGQPVLVGTHTIGMAQRCYEMLTERLADSAEICLLTGQSDAREAEFFNRAGVVGAVTVATQIAGRGVDIRLSEQAHENGGLVLIGLGHSRLARHDRQFLGRACRQGDPFYAQFVSSLEDPFFKDLKGTAAVKALLELMKVPDDAPITAGPILKRSIQAAQNDYRWYQLQSRRAELVLDLVYEQIGDEIDEYFRRLQGQEEGSDPDNCNPSLVTFLIDSFIGTSLASMISARRVLTNEQAARMADTISGIVGYNPDVPNCRALTMNLTGRTGAEARDIITGLLQKAINSASEANDRRLNRLHDLSRGESNAEKEANELQAALGQLAAMNSIIEEKIAELDAAAVKIPAQPVPAASIEAAGHDQAGEASPAPNLGASAGPADPAVAPAELAVTSAAADGTPTATRLAGMERLTISDIREAVGLAASPEDLRAIADFIRSAGSRMHGKLTAARRQADGGAQEEWSKLAPRTPRAVAWWSISTAWAAFIAESKITTEVLRRSNLPALQYYRVLNDRLLEQWRRCEADMASTSLMNLCRCWDPDGLDGLFVIADNLVVQHKRPDRTAIPDWQPSASDSAGVALQNVDDIIALFVQSQGQELMPDTAAKLIRLLKDFLTEAPLWTLQTPERIQRKVLGWQRDQRLRGIPDRRLRFDSDWIGKFLQFLNDRGLIAKLPSAPVRFRVTVSHLFENLGEARTILPLGGAVLFGIIFWLLSAVHLGPSRHLPPLLYLADGLASGGLVGDRAFTGPVAGGIIAGAAALALLSGLQYPRRAQILAAGLPWALLAAWSISWPWGDVLSLRMAAAVGLLIGMGLLLLLTMAVEFNVELWAGFRLMPLWLVVTSCLIFLPRLSMFGSGEPFTALVFAVLVCAYVVLHKVNRDELSVIFRHQKVLEELAEADLAVTAYRIEGSGGTRPHGFGLALAMSLQQLAWVIAATTTHRPLTALVGALVSIGAYCFAVIVWTVFTIQRRCSAAGWMNMLNTRSQVLGQEYGNQQLPSVLAAIQRKLIRRETITQVVLIATACALLYRFFIPGTRLPLALPLIFGAVVCAEQGLRLLSQLYSFLFLRAPAAAAAIDLPPVDDDEAAIRNSRMARVLRRRLTRIFAAVIAFITFSSAVVDATNVWKAVGEWIGHLFGH